MKSGEGWRGRDHRVGHRHSGAIRPSGRYADRYAGRGEDSGGSFDSVMSVLFVVTTGLHAPECRYQQGRPGDAMVDQQEKTQGQRRGRKRLARRPRGGVTIACCGQGPERETVSLLTGLTFSFGRSCCGCSWDPRILPPGVFPAVDQAGVTATRFVYGRCRR